MSAELAHGSIAVSSVPLVQARDSIPRLSPYSCVSCRTRKKKCDRIYPTCASCYHLDTECVFPPRRPSTRQKVPSEPLQRLRYLENVIDRLRADLRMEHPQPTGKEAAVAGDRPRGTPNPTTSVDPFVCTDSCNDKDASLEAEFGRLAIGNGKTRYVLSSFWASMNEEVEDLRCLLSDRHDEARLVDKRAPLNSGIHSTGQGFIFGTLSEPYTLSGLHPVPGIIPIYWQLFKENCDPIVKVLHIPTVEPFILQTEMLPPEVSRGFEALLFAIYFLVATSLSEHDCLHSLGSQKHNLIETYKFGMEKALARANFLETEELVVLQSFAIYLMGLRSHGSIKLMWTLTALAVRLAQNSGLHRDGTLFKLSPFDIEMRRRLWWAISILDSRASEDSGYDAAIPREGIDTQMPLNVDDTDLSPNITQLPDSKSGYTQMTFSLVRFEANNSFRYLQHMPAGAIDREGRLHATQSLAEKALYISRFQRRLGELFLDHGEPSKPFTWYIAAVSRILTNKMWLVAHHPYMRTPDCIGLPQETKDVLFLASIRTIEDWLQLLTEIRTARWRWLCETYMQWYALTFLLHELCIRTKGDIVDRAWNAVNAVLQGAVGILPDSSSVGWADCTHYLSPSVIEVNHDAFRPLKKLLQKARSARNGATALIGAQE